MHPSIADLVDPQDHTIGAFTFWLNETLYALSIRNVLSITQDMEHVSAVPQTGSGLLGIVRYQGSPVTVFDFAERLGVQSGRANKEALIEHLHGLESNHVNWLNDLEESVHKNSVFTGELDARRCEFGSWYRRFETRDEALQETVKQCEEPHEELHSIAERVISSKSSGRTDQALNELQSAKNSALRKLQFVLNQARQQLSEMARPVILYVTEDGRDVSFALRIDDVNNILTFTPAEFSPSARGESDVTLGCFCKEDEPDCLLVNIHSLIADRVIA